MTRPYHVYIDHRVHLFVLVFGKLPGEGLIEHRWLDQAKEFYRRFDYLGPIFPVSLHIYLAVPDPCLSNILASFQLSRTVC